MTRKRTTERSGIGSSAWRARPTIVAEDEQERRDAVLVRRWFFDENASIEEIRIRMTNASESFRRLHPIERGEDWIRAAVQYRIWATAEWEVKDDKTI